MRHAMMCNDKAIVSSKGQVVIPKMIRAELGIHAGHELIFAVRADGVMEIRPVARNIEMFFGRCKRAGAKPMTTQEMDEAIMQAVARQGKDQ